MSNKISCNPHIALRRDKDDLLGYLIYPRNEGESIGKGRGQALNREFFRCFLASWSFSNALLSVQ